MTHVDTAEELRRRCASGVGRSRMPQKSRNIWLLFSMRAMPVMHSFVSSGSVVKAHHCCLRRVGILTPNTFRSLLLLGIGRNVLVVISR